MTGRFGSRRVIGEGLNATAAIASPIETGLDASIAVGPRRKPSLVRSLLTGVGGLGFALGIERGASFSANVFAARWGGAEIFGAYSVALTAANNVAWYAGSGIGNTATRFISGHHPGTHGYRQVIRSLGIIAIISASVAAVALWIGAGPMAKTLLRNKTLVAPLQLAALSAAAFVLLEFCRGVFIGTRNFIHLIVLSALVGAGLLIVVPRAATLGVRYMVVGQAAALLVAIVVSLILIVRRPGSPPISGAREIESPPLASIWRFGLMQLGGVIGMNAAGWWTAMLVARGDASLLQIAFYTVATQLRNLCSLVPSLVQQSNFAFFTDDGAQDFGGAERVVAVSSIASSALATFFSGIGVLALPWILGHLYGTQYAHAELPSALAIATVLVHFGVSPAHSRLMVVSLLWAGAVNAVWAVFVLLVGTVLIPGAGATAATATLFLAHVLSTILVLVSLWWLGSLPDSVSMLAVWNTATALALGAISWFRAVHPNYSVGLNLLIIAVTGGVTWNFLRMGQRCGALPRPLNFASVWRAALPSNRGQA